MRTPKDPHVDALDKVVAAGLARLETMSQRIDGDAEGYRTRAAEIVAETKATLERLVDLLAKAPRLIPDASDAGLFVGQCEAPTDLNLSFQDLYLELYGYRFRLTGAVLRDPQLRRGERLSAVLLLQKITARKEA